MTNVDISIAPPLRRTPSEAAPGRQVARAAHSRINWIPVSITGIVLAIAYAPLLWLFFRQLWQKPHYQFFPFVIGAFAWLLWTRYRQSATIRRINVAPLWSARVLVFVAVLLLLFGLAIRSPWCAMVSFTLLLAAGFATVSQRRQITNLWGIWLLLCLMVPPPFNVDQQLITRLQFVSSRMSSLVLDAIGIQHVMDGNTLWLRSKQLFVDEACSGIISMLSILACALIYAVVKNRTPLHLVLLAATSIAWATLLNVFRISVIAYMLETWAIDWSSGTSHEMISLVLFLAAGAALLCTDHVLSALLAPIRPVWDQKVHFGRSLASAWDWLTAVGDPTRVADTDLPPQSTATAMLTSTRGGRLSLWLPALFAPVAAVQIALIAYAFQRAPERLASVQRALQLQSIDLPATLCGMKKVDFQTATRSADNINGKYSRTYLYRDVDGAKYVVSFDFPFPGFWHELTDCYVAAGWKPIAREVVSDAAVPQGEGPWKLVEASFAKPGGHFGSLCFAEFDQFGTPYDPEHDWVREGETFWKSRNLYLQERQIFQVQVWAENVSELAPGQRQKLRELLMEARKRLRGLVAKLDHADASTRQTKAVNPPAERSNSSPAEPQPPKTNIGTAVSGTHNAEPETKH